MQSSTSYARAHFETYFSSLLMLFGSNWCRYRIVGGVSPMRCSHQLSKIVSLILAWRDGSLIARYHKAASANRDPRRADLLQRSESMTDAAFASRHVSATRGRLTASSMCSGLEPTRRHCAMAGQ